MGLYSAIDIIRREGLPPAERGFVIQAIHRAMDEYIFSALAPEQVYGYAMHGIITDEDLTGALLAPASFAAVLADVCRLLKVPVPDDVERALGGKETEDVREAC